MLGTPEIASPFGETVFEDTGRTREMSDIAERVKKIVVEHLGVEADKVTDGASFIDDLGADSLAGESDQIQKLRMDRSLSGTAKI